MKKNLSLDDLTIESFQFTKSITVTRTRPDSDACSADVPTGTDGKGIRLYDPDRRQRLEITVPENGKYNIFGYGTYDGKAYATVNVYLYILDVIPNDIELKKEEIYDKYNYNSKIGATIEATLELKKGQIIALGYGNLSSGDRAACNFWYGYNGDFLTISKL